MKRTFAAFILTAFVLTSTFGVNIQAAHAQLATYDAANHVQNILDTGENTISAVHSISGCNLKDCALDGLAWSLAKMAVQTMTRSVVNWINSGFNGSPSFASDLQTQFTMVGLAVAGSFVNQLVGAINSPFRNAIGSLLQLTYLSQFSQTAFFTQNVFTLGNFSINPLAFLGGDFSQGGWAAWFALQQPQNNFYGEYFAANNEMQKRIAAAQANKNAQLNWGQGFLSWCGGSGIGNGTTHTIKGSPGVKDMDGNIIPGTDLPDFEIPDASQPNPAEACVKSDGTPGRIQTPGSVIVGQLNHTLGLSGDSLVSADEIDEIIGALMAQLVGQVLGATGLLGASADDFGGSALDQATDPSQLTDNSGTQDAESNFDSAVANEIDQLTQYQSDWQTLQNAVTAAETSCNIVGVTSTTTMTTNSNIFLVNEANRVANGLARATNVLTRLQKIQAEETRAEALPSTGNVAVGATTTVAVGTATDTTVVATSSDTSSTTSALGSLITSSIKSTATSTTISAAEYKTQALTKAATDFQSFLSAASTPSATDIAQVHADAQSTSPYGNIPDAPKTVLMKIQDAGSACYTPGFTLCTIAGTTLNSSGDCVPTAGLVGSTSSSTSS